MMVGMECDLIVHHSHARSTPAAPLAAVYCTESVKVVWLTLVPLVAVTVTFDTPGGVPEFEGGGFVPPPPPPPQPGTVTIISMISRNIARVRCCFPPTSTTENSSPRPISDSASKKVRRWGVAIAVAAVVVTVTVTFVVPNAPVALTLEGLKPQVASEGRPAHASVIVPLKFGRIHYRDR